MGMHQPLHQQSHSPSSSAPANGYFLSKAVFAGLFCTALCVSLLHLLCCGPPREHESVVSRLQQENAVSSDQHRGGGSGCDYSEGRWVRDPGHARRYNGTECGVTNSVGNGRPDTGYLDWRWQPAGAGCHLPAFDAAAFLAAVRGMHVAFVGDSMVRNQAESLVCLIAASSSSFPYRRVHRPGSRGFRRWAFQSHNVTVSSYWAQFLVPTAVAAGDRGGRHNSVHLDALAERWSADANTMDVAVISTSHWFWDRAVYYNGSDVLETFNHTRIGFFAPYREAVRMSVERLSSGRGAAGRPVVVATVSPAHFEKAWDDTATCARKEPCEEGEMAVASLEEELRKIAREEASAARNGGGETTIKVLDVTKLATMRPDGHPGVYMRRDPFGRGMPERARSDCLHFCLPGPVDTFNEILQQLLTEAYRLMGVCNGTVIIEESIQIIVIIVLLLVSQVVNIK